MGPIRLLLAFSVVVVHSGPLFGYPFTAMVFGKNAVQMFYTISGFYMALILNSKYTGPGSYRTFITSRFLRIYPAYAAVALATIASGIIVHATLDKLIPFFRAWAQYGSTFSPLTLLYLIGTNLLLVGQDASMLFWIPPGSGTLTFIGEHAKLPLAQQFLAVPQAWTVGTELWFYLLAPLLVRRMSRIASAMAAGLAIRLTIIHGLGYANDSWNYRFFPAELPLFLAGALGYHAYAALEAKRVPMLWPGRLAFFGMLSLIVANYKLPWRWFPSPEKALQLELIELIFPVALPFIFAYTRRSYADRVIGELSYPVYLIHWLVIDLLHVIGSPRVEQNIGTFACFLTLASSVVLWYLVDRPIDAWRQTLAREKSREAERPHRRQAPGHLGPAPVLSPALGPARDDPPDRDRDGPPPARSRDGASSAQGWSGTG